MRYHAYRLADPDDGFDETPLGTFPDYAAALAACDADTVRRFAAAEIGALVRTDHRIVGPGVCGAVTSHPVITETPRRTAGATEVAEMRRWLDVVHGRTGT